VDHANDQAVNSRLLVLQQKMHGSQKCCGELAELRVDDIWQIADASDQKLLRLAHSSQQDTTNTESAMTNNKCEYTQMRTTKDGHL